MVSAVAMYTTPFGAHPYLTNDEYRAAPTSVDTTNLVPRGVDGDEDAALAACILAASAEADEVILGQSLASSLDIEVQRVRASRDGMLHVHPKNWPILEVRDVQWGPWPGQMTGATDLSGVWIEEQQFHVPLSGGGSMTTLGPLQFAGAFGSGQQLYIRYAYVNGWPDTLTTAPPGDASATSLTVVDSTGIYGGGSVTAKQLVPAGSRLRLIDGQFTKNIQIAGVAGNVLTLAAPTVNAHASNVVVSALPAAVKEAIVLLTSGQIKTRGTESIVMQQANQIGALQNVDPVGRSDRMTAFDMLRPYRRVK